MSGRTAGCKSEARDETERALAADAAVDAAGDGADDMRAESARRARVFPYPLPPPLSPLPNLLTRS